MIELKELRKSYKTGSFEQKALDGVSLCLRDNEFVAVLGPSGSGKTTLLNVLGGLDHADSGDIVINGTSTKDYRSSDWDTYRNHRIGFIFQSYNLIPHQSVLSNVELALTLSGVKSRERKQRATEALQRVGLGEHIDKKPSQLSGGQMQRVAIARALVNDPEIVLADEPTGALDTETGIQVMNLLKEIANDRLVVMVTHNPELAEEYATRIVRLADGKIVADTMPLTPEVAPLGSGTIASSPEDAPLVSGTPTPSLEDAPLVLDPAAESTLLAAVPSPDSKATQPKKRARMGFLTALGLSFNNLMTKKGRTFMTAFAGSIGIIGIAAILSLSNGVNNYIAQTEEEALTSYPLTITKSSFDLTNLFGASIGADDDEDADAPEESNFQRGWRVGIQGQDDTVQVRRTTGNIPEIAVMTDMFAQVKNNNLTAFKEYLDKGDSGIEAYVHTIQYGYNVVPQIYKTDTSKGVVRLNPSSMGNTLSGGFDGSAFGFSGTGTDMFAEMMDNRELLQSYMDVVAGRWPESYDECLLVLSSTGRLTDYTLYSIGYYDTSIMDQMTQDVLSGKEVTAPKTAQDFTVEKALDLEFSVVPIVDTYQYNKEQNIWTDMSSDSDAMKDKVAGGIKLKVVGVVQPSPQTNSIAMQQGIAYTPELTKKLMDLTAESDIVKQQQKEKDTDVFTGLTFEELQEGEGADFDFESMFTVDEEAINSAFNFDTSALEDSMTFDESALDIDPNLIQIDPNALQMDASVLESVLSEAALQDLFAGAPQFDLENSGILESAGELSSAQQKALNDATNQLSADFLSWVVTANKVTPGAQPDYSALFQEYLRTDNAQKILAPVGQQVGTEVSDQVNVAMQTYLATQFVPYISDGMQQMFEQAGQLMAIEMAYAIQEQMYYATESMGVALTNAISGQMANNMTALEDALETGFDFDPDKFAGAIQFNMDQDDLMSLLTNFMNANDLTYDGNMKKLGYAKLDSPESVSIYPKDFQSKEAVLRIIDDYNATQKGTGKDDASIQYSDFAGVLMSSVTNIVDTISLVLIAFVSISLVVSSIMISIITYISVLERKKEIGILRAMGASKGNVANVFNAETFIEGLIAGVLAIAVVMAVSVPINAFVKAGWDVPNVMSLPPTAAVILIGISVVLTLLAGLIPSQAASRRDPVEALRSE